MDKMVLRNWIGGPGLAAAVRASAQAPVTSHFRLETCDPCKHAWCSCSHFCPHTFPPRCEACPNAYCEDCLPEEHQMVGECDHFKAMGQVRGRWKGQGTVHGMGGMGIIGAFLCLLPW